MSGYSEAHRALEEALADWLGYPRALLFISGFAANQALIAALVEKDDRIVADRLSHASAGGGEPQPWRSCGALPTTIRSSSRNCWPSRWRANSWRSLKAFSAWTATAAPLAAIHAATQAAGQCCWWMTPTVLAWSATKDAELRRAGGAPLSCWWLPSAGLRRQRRGGAVRRSNGRLSAAVCPSSDLHSTAMPPAQAVALSAALGIIRSDEGQQRRDILAARIRQFREGMGEVSLGLTDSVMRSSR